jgi:glycerol uptake facilitator-like aquaporin
MIIHYFIEFISTILFSYIVLSANNVLIIGAIFTLIIYLNKKTMFMNPAMTLLMYSGRKISIHDVIPFCLAQIVGVLLALEIKKNVRNN